MIIIPSSSTEKLAKRIADRSGSVLSAVERKRFPDGELYVRVEGVLKGQDAVVVGSTRSDTDFLELLFLLNAAREGGGTRVTAVVPYYGYSRQHRRYRDGEPVSSKVMTKAIEEFSDRIVCVEIHDEETLGFSSRPFTNLSVINTVSDYFRNRNIDMIMSPDDGGFDRASRMAKILGIPAHYIDKKRIDSKTVEMHLPKDVDFSGKSVLLVDDIISTGGTIIKAVKLLKENGASRISVSAVHGVFAKDSDRTIAGMVDELVVTDTIETPHNLISVAADISESLKQGE